MVMVKGLWSPEEDEKLRNVLMEEEKEGQYGTRFCTSWNNKARKAGLGRSGKSCRRRWMNHLRPGIKRGLKFSQHETALVLQLQEIYGNKWTKIAAHLEGRTDNDVKNLWHGLMRRKRAADRTLHNHHQPNCGSSQQQTMLANPEPNQQASMVNYDNNSITLPPVVDDLVSHEKPKSLTSSTTALSPFFSNDSDFMLLLLNEQSYNMPFNT